MNSPRLLSIQVGKPQKYGTRGAKDPMEKPWESGIVKMPVSGTVRLTRLGLEGDGQADPLFHGGEDKAMLAYSAGYYPLWKEALGLPDFPFGAFGENLTIDGLDETIVCVGDIFAIGDVRVQVSQPRGPCWKISRRWKIKDLTARVEATGRTGWYLRVLEEGLVEAGMTVELLERPNPEWLVSYATEIRKNRAKWKDIAFKLASCAPLSKSWKDALLFKE